MSMKQKLAHELRALAATTLFFGCWIAALLVFKSLLLAEYEIAFHGWSMALIGALILSKVVILTERVSFGSRVREAPAWVDLVLRTGLYTLGVVLVLILERGIEGRHEHGGFINAVSASFQSIEAAHFWVNAICISGALFCYNALAVIRSHLDESGLLGLFLIPLPKPSEKLH
jgi:hypothetical protein